MSSNALFEDGQLGFVLIPMNEALLKEDSHSQQVQRMYWPALLFKSSDALLRALPSKSDQELFHTEWKCHERFNISGWKRRGLVTRDDGPVEVALLLGSEIPPCGTRSFPIRLQDMPAVTGGELHKPYVVLGRKMRSGLKQFERYASNVRFLEALDLGEQYLKTKDVKLVFSSLKWLELPDGCYCGADSKEFTVKGWMWWGGNWHPTPALPSEAELERTYPTTYKYHPKPSTQESYPEKNTRITKMRRKPRTVQGKGRANASKISGVKETTIISREKRAGEALQRTGEMHLYDAVKEKIWALPKATRWYDDVMNSIIHEARKEWRIQNIQASASNGGSAASSLLGSVASTSVSTESPSNLVATDTISASAPTDRSPTAAPARITPDKPQNDATSNESDSSASSPSDNENAQPKRKKQKRSRREVTDLVIPGSLPREGIEWETPVRELSLSRAYGLESLPQQPAFTVMSNDDDHPFYAEGTGIEAVEMHFLPKNVRFPNDAVMNQAAINARTVVARVFGDNELIGQRERKYSAYKFNTVSLVDMTVSPTTSAPLNKCMSVLYFSPVENTRSLWIEWFATSVEYRGKKLGLSTLLLQSVLDLAILDNRIDHIYLEVGRDKEGEGKWKAARHVYEKAGFNVVGNDDLTPAPDEIVECCKHFGDFNYDVMRFDCDGKRVPRKSTRRGGTRSRSSSASS